MPQTIDDLFILDRKYGIIDKLLAKIRAMDNLQQLLSEAKLSSLVESQEIVLLEHNQTVADALKVSADQQQYRYQSCQISTNSSCSSERHA